MRKVLDRGLFVAVCLGVFLVAGPTSLGGSTSYVIVDGTSMEPTYHSGDLVVARRRATYAVGDVITYDAPVGRPYRVIHRVTEVADTGYLTQGDGRDEPDGWVVPFDAVHGASALVVPHAGTVATWLRNPPIVIALLAGWLTLTLLTRRETRRDQAADAAAPDGAVDDRQPVTGDRVGRRAYAVLLTGMAVLGLAAGVLVANAAALVVDGGTLQVFASDDRPPPVERARITVQWRLFNNGGGETSVLPPDQVLDLAEGDPYAVASRDGTHGGSTYREVACGTVRVEAPTGDRSGSGTWSATSSGLHLVCLQHRPGSSG